MRSEGPGSRSSKPGGEGRGRGSASSARSKPRGALGPLGPAAAPSDRPAQVAGEIRRALQEEFARGLNDPRVQGMVSITEVVLTPDLAEARVRVSVLPEDRASLTLSGLRAAAGFLRRRVMDETRIGRVPRIGFELDDRLKRQAALDSVLREDAKDAAGSAAGAANHGERAGGPADSEAENTTR
jgi:ribosome-binding factor A